jgi:diguanylate cyclase
MRPRHLPIGRILLGATDRQRVRVSQSLLGVPILLLIDALLILEWRLGLIDGGPITAFASLTLAGCWVFYLIARLGLGERLSLQEPSVSAPQMAYAMVCVAWGYALAGPYRAALLCLMPLILCFGIFALKVDAARALANFGIALMGINMCWLAARDSAVHEPWQEAANWAFMAASMVMVRILSARLGRMRARLSEQKAELAAALEHIRLLATRDALTGLLNRRAAQDELQRAVRTAARESRPLTVALADLDHFKMINDSYGHQTGDRVLQAFSRAAESEVRGADRVARWGGEEFLFVLPATDEHEATICLERVRALYAAADVEGLPASHALNFSAGVALCHGPDDIDAAIERADRAMYNAKIAGRARTFGRELARMETEPPRRPAPTEAATPA